MLVRGLAFGILGLVMSCNTVPDDAPQEFFAAEAAIEEMDEKDVDDYLPKTAERAEESFEQALDMLDELDEENPEATRDGAISKANEAKMTAQNATQLHTFVAQADESDTQFQDALAMMNRSDDVDVAVVAPVSPFAMLKDTQIVSTLAYFETASSSDPKIKNAEMQALVEILEKSDSFQVELIGHADQRGDANMNEELAMARAQTVAATLRDRGISDSQIMIKSVGEQNADAAAGNPIDLFLDRNVSAMLIVR